MTTKSISARVGVDTALHLDALALKNNQTQPNGAPDRSAVMKTAIYKLCEANPVTPAEIEAAQRAREDAA